MKVTALMAVRNEADYLRVTLKYLTSMNIRLAILDNESTDDTAKILDEYKQFIDYYKVIPFKGTFNLIDQLKEKSKAIQSIDADWIIHQAPDEILESPVEDEILIDGIERIADQGYTAINFDEFVFTPTLQHSSFEDHDFYKEMLYYYFFEPKPFRLNRVWKNTSKVLVSSAGHAIKSSAGLSFTPESFILRHYMVLSYEHAHEKYFKRKFARKAIRKGWHKRRLEFPSAFSFPDENILNKLSGYQSKNFKRDNPWSNHFWQ